MGLIKRVYFFLVFCTVQSSLVDFQLKEIFHHGAEYQNLFRSINFDSNDIATQEKLSKTLLKHTLKMVFSNYTFSFNKRQHHFNKHILKIIPDVTDQSTVLSFAKMSFNAYIEPHKEGWLDLDHEYDAEDSFGWKEDGIRAHLFSNKLNSIIVLAFKGATTGYNYEDGRTSVKDKFNNNLMFSCCCAYIDYTWHNVCGCYKQGYTCGQTCLEESVQEERGDIYYFAAQKIISLVEKKYPEAQLFLTGHSLGGGLSGLLGLAYGLPTVTFESPGDLLPARRLHLPLPTYPGHSSPHIWHFGHNSDPIFTGDCTGMFSSCYLSGYAMESKCHTGSTCVYDTRSKRNWSSDIFKHRIGFVIDEIIEKWDGVPTCTPEVDCKDCAPWQFV